MLTELDLLDESEAIEEACRRSVEMMDSFGHSSYEPNSNNNNMTLCDAMDTNMFEISRDASTKSSSASSGDSRKSSMRNKVRETDLPSYDYIFNHFLMVSDLSNIKFLISSHSLSRF